MVWPHDNHQWKWRDRAPNQLVSDAYQAAFEKLVGLPPFDASYRFSPAAQNLFIEWMEEIQKEARSGDIHPVLETHLIKMPQTVASLSLLFELLEKDTTNVGEEATAKALDFADYLKSHAERLYGMTNNVCISNAKLIFNRRNKLPSPFTLRNIHQRKWVCLSDRQDVQDAIDILLDCKYVSAELVNVNGGRPTMYYYWNQEVNHGSLG